jgi:hypothetical protein
MPFPLARYCLLSLYAALLLLWLPISALAGPEEEAPQPSLLDVTHQEISERLTAYSRWFDKFFSDPRFDEEPGETLLRLRGSTRLTEYEGLSYDGKIKALLDLPNLKRRFHLILSSERDDLREETLKDARINRELARNTSDTTLALQYTQKRSGEISLTHRFGVDLEDGLNPQIRSRIRYSLPIAKQSLLSLTQAVFWENHDGFGEESRIDFDVPLYQNMLLRTSGQGLFSQSSRGYEWLAMVQWLTSLTNDRAFSLGAFTTGETRPQNRLIEYNLFSKYRQRFIKKWLFFEVQPEVYWLREKDFQTTFALTLTLEIQFGE